MLPRFESCLGGKVYLLVVHELWSLLFVLHCIVPAVQKKINTSGTKLTYNQWSACLPRFGNSNDECLSLGLIPNIYEKYPKHLQAISLPVTVSKSGKVNKEILLPMMVKALPFNSSNMCTNCEIKGTRSVREHGSVNQAECHSPSETS